MRVYIAGAYSAPSIGKAMENIRRGIRAGVEVLLAGHAPFCPWTDFLLNLQFREGENVTIEDFYQYSLAWLEVSDALLVLPYSENSKGTQAEIARALTLGLPVAKLPENYTEEQLAATLTWLDSLI